MHWQFQQDSRWGPALPNAFTSSFLLTPGRSTCYTFIHILTIYSLQSEDLQHLAHEFIFIGRTENTHIFSGAGEPCRPWWGITADNPSPPPSHWFSRDASERCTEAPSVQTPWTCAASNITSSLNWESWGPFSNLLHDNDFGLVAIIASSLWNINDS